MHKIPVAQSPVGAWGDRMFSVLTAGTGVFFAVLLAGVRPDPRGHGTHEQLNMAPCSWPIAFDAPCPTCGVTTAACRLVHLDPIGAVAAQPFGAALAGAGLALAVWGAFCLLTGRAFMDRIVRLPYGTITVWTLVLFLGSWLYKYLTFIP